MVIWVKATVDIVSHGKTQQGVAIKSQEPRVLSKFIDIDKSWNAEQVGNVIAESIESDLKNAEEKGNLQFLWSIEDIKIING